MNYLVMFGIMLIIMIPVGIYSYHLIGRMVCFWWKKEQSKWMKGIIGIISLLVAMGCANPYGTPALVLYHILAVAVVLEVINGIFYFWDKKNKKNKKNRHIWKKLYRCGLIPILVTAIIMTYGHYHMLDIREKDYTVTTEKSLSQENGYQVAFLSDLHFGTTMEEDRLEEVCREISAKSPDLVILGGDIVDENTTKEQMQHAFAILSSITSKYGTFYVYGNHDSARHSSTPHFAMEDLNQAIEENGIQCMADNTCAINDDFLLVGRNDRGYRSGTTRASTDELLTGQDTKRFILLVDHQPSDLEENAKAGVDLQLSGHTHGGQIWPMGFWSDTLGFGEMNYGERRIGDYEIIVSSGIAGWGYAVRTGHDSEYLMIHLHS